MFLSGKLEYSKAWISSLKASLATINLKSNLVEIETKHFMHLMRVLGTMDQLLLKITGPRCVKKLKRAIISGEDINAVTQIEKKSALHIAAARDDSDSVLALIEARATIELQDWKLLTPLQRAGKGSMCQDILRLHGADNWSLLLTSAEKGEKYIKQCLRVRSVLSSLVNQKVFEKWFPAKVERFSNSTTKVDWTWDSSQCDNAIKLDHENVKESSSASDKLRASKILDTSEFSIAAGTDLNASQGICCLEFCVQNVKSVWLGICSISETVKLAVHPTQSAADLLIAFHSSGKESSICLCSGSDDAKAKLESFGGTQYRSGDRICFILNMEKKTLKMKINGVKSYHLNDLSIPEKGILRPFVCMQHNETVTFTRREQRSFKKHSPDSNFGEDKFGTAKRAALVNEYWKDVDQHVFRNYSGILSLLFKLSNILIPGMRFYFCFPDVPVL
jgi:hypothetical protein